MTLCSYVATLKKATFLCRFMSRKLRWKLLISKTTLVAWIVILLVAAKIHRADVSDIKLSVEDDALHPPNDAWSCLKKHFKPHLHKSEWRENAPAYFPRKRVYRKKMYPTAAASSTARQLVIESRSVVVVINWKFSIYFTESSKEPKSVKEEI